MQNMTELDKKKIEFLLDLISRTKGETLRETRMGMLDSTISLMFDRGVPESEVLSYMVQVK